MGWDLGWFVRVRAVIVIVVGAKLSTAGQETGNRGRGGRSLFFFLFFCPPVDMRNIEGYVQVCRGKGNVPGVVGGIGMEDWFGGVDLTGCG